MANAPKGAAISAASDFVGSGRRLAQGDVGDAARWLGVETAVLLSFMEVEAAGRGFDGRARPKMLFEPHVFWRELGAGQKRDRAAREGLAYSNWGAAKYPADSYPRLRSAMSIDQGAALRSASWGLGQIMGFNSAAAGHQSVESMIQSAIQGEREQLWSMVTLMRTWGMVPMLTGRDFTKASSWEPAALKWNGAGFATHNYHGRIADAYLKHSGRKDDMRIPEATGGPLRLGMKGELVRNLQNDLAGLGYEFTLGIDGRFGPETDGIVRAFQTQQGLTVDGVVGTATKLALAEALANAAEVKQPPAPEWAGQGAPPTGNTNSAGQAGGPQRLPRWIAILIGLGAAVAVAIAALITGNPL